MLFITGAINVGVQTHAYFEARDSVSHFEEKRKEEAQEDPSIDLQAPPHPHSRLGEAQEVRTRVGERWLLSFAGFLFFGGLAVLGGRRLAQARR